MRMKNKTLAVVTCTILIAASIGCTPTANRTEGAMSTRPLAQSDSATARKFKDAPLHGTSAVESALELSQKYARLSDHAAALKEENQALTAENKQLKERAASLEAQLAQTRKELDEANQLLIEMLSELNNWKSNILGFRSEMRDAAKAQLEALLKVLEILGGETQTTTPPTEIAEPTDLSSIDTLAEENQPTGQTDE